MTPRKVEASFEREVQRLCGDPYLEAVSRFRGESRTGERLDAGCGTKGHLEGRGLGGGIGSSPETANT